MYILIPGGLNNCQWLNLKGQHVDISEATKTTYTHFLAESAHSCLGVLMKRNLPQPSIHYQQHYQPIAIKQHSNGQEIPTTTFPPPNVVHEHKQGTVNKTCQQFGDSFGLGQQ